MRLFGPCEVQPALRCSPLSPLLPPAAEPSSPAVMAKAAPLLDSWYSSWEVGECRLSLPLPSLGAQAVCVVCFSARAEENE